MVFFFEYSARETRMTAKEGRTTIETLLRCDMGICWLEKNDQTMTPSIAIPFRELSRKEKTIVYGDH